jgi:nucleoid-associated protein YgaU
MVDTKQNPKDGLALVVGGLFILALVFASYNYFNKKQPAEENQEGQTALFQKETGSINGEGATDKSGVQALGTGGPVTTGQKWVATDYQKGDIKGPTHTVRSGDTLWEIAEAVYGNGAMWTKILQANAPSIGFLPNGSQALIVPGQVLILP